MVFVIAKLGHSIYFDLERDLDISTQTLLMFGCCCAVPGMSLSILPGLNTKKAAIVGKDIRHLNFLSITEINSKVNAAAFAFSCYFFIFSASLQGKKYAHVQEVWLARVSNSPPLAICSA